MKDFIIFALVVVAAVFGLMAWSISGRPPKKVVKTVVKREQQVVIKRAPPVQTPVRAVTWAEANPAWTALPSRLRWWERKDITPVAIALTEQDNLERFHALLGRRIPEMEACRGKGLDYALPWITVMRTSIDLFLKRMMQARKGSMEWWVDRNLCWVAAIMISGDNLKNLHAFVGQQRRKLAGCATLSWRTPTDDPSCAELLAQSAVQIDAYFKKIVNDHGGPLIDRNWNKP